MNRSLLVLLVSYSLQGPFQPPGGKPNEFPFVAQGSGLDLVLAALSILQAREGAAQ